jgi:LAS superfamily LD-carboxypeptidase LdcB
VNDAELTGQVRTHIVDVPEPACALHKNVVAPFASLRRAALNDGFDIVPVSSFRDFSRQLSIWNAKFSGERPVYDAAGQLINPLELAPFERIETILLWSALPGASRHHWGTDVDLIDARAIAKGYRAQLTTQEYAPGGPFAALAEWLDASAHRFGFFRPFRGELSGVQPEPWHFSFAPVAESARRNLSAAVLREAVATAPLLGKNEVLARLDELHARYVVKIDWP